MRAAVPESEIESMAEVCNVPNLFLVHNEPLRSILFNRNLIGLPFRHACLQASRLFVRHLADDLSSGELAELLILSKGLVYQLGEAVAAEVGKNLPTNLISTSRVSVASDDLKIEVQYARLDAGGSTLLIGDTVASGATIVAALEAYRASWPLRQLYVISCAGATIGARRIVEYCQQHDVACTILFGLASFGLGENGFDLSFLHPDTIAREEYKARAAAQFGDRAVSSVGWDFGTQSMAPEKYARLCWVEAELHGLHGSKALAVEQEPEDLNMLANERTAFSREIPFDG